MGLLERSKSLMRKPSILSISRNDDKQEKRQVPGGFVNVTHGQDIENTYLLTLDAKQSQQAEHAKQHRRSQSVSNYEQDPTRSNKRLSHRASVQGLMSGQHRTLSVRRSKAQHTSPKEVLQSPTTSSAFTMPPEEAQLFNRNRATIGITLGSPRLLPPNYLDSPAASDKTIPQPSPVMNVRHSSPVTPMPPLLESYAPAQVRKDKSRGFRALLKRTGSDLASMLPGQSRKTNGQNHRPSSNESSSNSEAEPHRMLRSERYAPGASGSARRESPARGTKPLPEVPSSAQQAKLLRRSSAPMRSSIEQSAPRYVPAQAGTAQQLSTKPSGTGSARRPLPTRVSSLPVSNYNTSSPVLNIDIPDTQMERYSVMFEKLLLPPQPTLSQRRNGNTMKLQPLRENPTRANTTVENGTLQRRVTSPGLVSKPAAKTSPKTHIISAQTDDRAQVARQMKFVRSVTAPVISLSAPNRTDLASPAWSEPSLPPTPVSGRTFNTMGEDTAICPNESYIMPRNTEADKSTPTGRPAPRRVDSLGPQKASEIQERQAAQVEAAQISIARRVSVTRRPGPLQKTVVVQRSSKPQVVQAASRKKSIFGLIEQ